MNDWVTLAKRYAGNPAVVGFDLRNEPHTPAGDSYAQGATWGTADPGTDVRLAYEQAGNAILAADPGALVFCEGISENPNSSGGFDSTWWGGDLAEAGQFPVVLSSPGHVVYSAHDYGPSLFQQTWFNSSTTSASLDAVWNKFWGYLYAQGIAPLWVGEFGTDNTASDVSSTVAGSQGQWFSSLVSYIKANNLSWTYWALNGEDSYALLDNNYDPALVSARQAEPAGHHRVPAARRVYRVAVADRVGRAGVLPGGLLADQHLAGRVPGADRARQHRHRPDLPVDAHVHVRRRPEDRQLVERQLHPVR